MGDRRPAPLDAPPDSEPDRAGGLRPAAFIREHPWITAIMVVSTLGGAGAGPLLLDETWSLARQVGAGGFLGAWVGLTITVTKMI